MCSSVDDTLFMQTLNSVTRVCSYESIIIYIWSTLVVVVDSDIIQ